MASKARELADVIGTQDTTENVLQGRRNLIINGAMQVSQRGTYTSATSCTNNTYYLDRYFISLGTVTATIQQTTVTINSVEKKAQKISATSSGTGYMGIGQRIEIDNLEDGQTYTASCWVRSNNSNTSFRHTFPNSYTDTSVFTNDGNWEKVSATFTLTKGSQTYIDVGLNTYQNGTVSISSGDYIEFTDFQVEVGSVATPFEHRSYGEELALCQRYFQSVTPHMTGRSESAATEMRVVFNYPTTMRAAPTGTFPTISTTGNLEWNPANISGGFNGGGTLESATVDGARVDVTDSAITTDSYVGLVYNVLIQLDAEL